MFGNVFHLWARYLNAGLTIGYVWAYLDMLEEYGNRGMISDDSDDQRFWQTVFLSNRSFVPLSDGGRRIIPDGEKPPHGAIPYISIDYHQNLFQSLLQVDKRWFDFNQYIRTGRVAFNESGGLACGFHQHGHKPNGPDALYGIFRVIDDLERTKGGK